MINFKFLKQGARCYIDVYRGSENRRFGDMSFIDQYLCIENLRKNQRHFYDKTKKLYNLISKILVNKVGKKLTTKIYKIALLKSKIHFFEKKVFLLENLKNETLNLIGNLIHNSSSFNKNDCISRLFHIEGQFAQDSKTRNHVDLFKMIDGVDYKRGVNVAGQRGYFLKSPGLVLNLSILRYGIDFLSKRNFIALQTPLFMDKKMIKKCSQLSDFDEQLYFLGNLQNKYLIATSEQPISSFHFNEILGKKNLPLRYAGYSSCFRKETGNHGKDTSGIFRVHNFEKIEQFVFSDSSCSWKIFEEMIKNACDFYRTLHLPFLAIEIPSGSVNSSASKKIDILGWFPSSRRFRELVSCSNCTDFQSREMNILIDSVKKENFIHLLNSTLCASSRTICCILENCQNSKGILLPDVLKSYTGFSFLPFTRM